MINVSNNWPKNILVAEHRETRLVLGISDAHRVLGNVGDIPTATPIVSSLRLTTGVVLLAVALRTSVSSRA